MSVNVDVMIDLTVVIPAGAPTTLVENLRKVAYSLCVSLQVAGEDNYDDDPFDEIENGRGVTFQMDGSYNDGAPNVFMEELLENLRPLLAYSPAQVVEYAIDGEKCVEVLGNDQEHDEAMLRFLTEETAKRARELLDERLWKRFIHGLQDKLVMKSKES